MDLSTHAPSPVEATPTVRQQFPRWPAVLLVAIVLMGAVVIAAWQVTIPFYALSPGPVEEVDDLIEIPDQATFDSAGGLLMLTVSLQEVNVFEYARGLFDPAIDLVDREIIRPADVSPDEFRRANRQAMDDSKETAIAVALRHLGYDVTLTGEGVYVAAVLEGTPADGVLRAGDVITEVDGVSVTIRDDGIGEINKNAIGDTISLRVDRDGEDLDLEVTLIEHTEAPGQPMVGFQAQTFNEELVLPFDVDIDTQNIGGPSAGLMYALTIVDLLTEDDLTRGQVIAGTGTINSQGEVGTIGGVRQKAVAAEAAGATMMLVPAGNYEEALTAPVEDIELISVATLDEAIAALAAAGTS
jgi:PDZ domain-containing protein